MNQTVPLPSKNNYQVVNGSTETLVFDVHTNTIIRSDSAFDTFIAGGNLEDSEQERCNQYLKELNNIGILSSKKRPIPEYESPIYKLSLEVFSGCNMRCTYCYNSIFNKSEIKPERANFEDLKKSIDYFVTQFGKKAKAFEVNIVGGGEPLLNFGLIKKLRTYCDQLSLQVNKNIVFWIFTNGTVFTHEILDFLIDSKQSLTISLDGPPEVHNKLRPLPNGKESFPIIEEWIKIIKEKAKGKGGIENFWASAVITAEHNSISEIVETYAKLGVKQAQIRPIRTSNSELEFSVLNFDKLADMYREFQEYLIKDISENGLDKLKIILNERDYFGRQIIKVMQGYHTPYRCGAGKSKLCIRANGKIYPCDIGSDKKELTFGTISNFELNIDDIFKAHVDKKQQCKVCWARYLCGGGCLVSAKDRTGKLENPDPMECRIHKIILSEVILFVYKLSSLHPEWYNRIKKYISNHEYVLNRQVYNI